MEMVARPIIATYFFGAIKECYQSQRKAMVQTFMFF